MADTLKTRPFVIARRVRLVCGVLAVMSIAGFLASAHTAFLLMHRSWAIGITGGCFEIGQDPYVRRWGSITPTPDNGVNFVTQQSWDGGYSAAWRPFRAGSSKASRLMFPLWHPMLGFGIIAAFAHGVIVGGRRADRATCIKCGYDISALPKSAERRCPECGELDARVKPAPHAAA